MLSLEYVCVATIGYSTYIQRKMNEFKNTETNEEDNMVSVYFL